MPRPLARLVSLFVLASCVLGPATGDTSGTTGTDGTTSTSNSTATSSAGETTAITPTTTGACEDYTISVQIPIVIPELMLVLDQSPAMLDPWDHDGDPQTPDRPRWASVRAALLTVLAPEPFLDLGLAPYPTPDAKDTADAAACTVTPGLLTPPGGASPAELLSGLAPAMPPPGSFVGGAPLRAALLAAAALLPGSPDQPRFLLVFANSAANCDPGAADSQQLLETLDLGALDAATAAFAAGVPMFIYGIGAATQPSPVQVDHRPDDVFVSATLADIAAAGGGSYVNVASEAELIAELAAQFEHEGGSCSFELSPEPGPDQAVTNVRVDGQDFPPVLHCGSEDGWQLVGTTVELCGAACTRFQETGILEILVICV